VLVQGKGAAMRRLRAAFVVDASGDANAAVLAGADAEAAPSALLQHASFIFRIDGASATDALERARATMQVARAARRGRLADRASSVVFRPGAGGGLFATLNLAKPAARDFDPLDEALLAELKRSACEDAEAIVAFLAAEHPAFAGALVGARPQRVGVRETRRVRGLARIEERDVLEGRRRDDEACVSTWPVERWQDRERLTFLAVAGPSSIPLGCLVADHPSRRLAVAGRCVSASHEALGALRVVATAMATGEAAGAAAALALAASSDLSAVNPASVRRAVASGLTTSQW
jgi:hypothetical protein